MAFQQFRPFQTSTHWAFINPENQRELKANTKGELIVLIVSYRMQNGFEPIEFLEQVVDNHLCNHPSNAGRCEPMPELKRGVWETIQGGIALLKTYLYKRFATQEEADRRASICKTCPHNIFPNKGDFIKWCDTTAELAVENRKSIHHNDLGNCSICSCNMRAKVFYDDVIQLTQDQINQAPDFCWQKVKALSGK
jgi:hypothetical protein